MTRQTNSQAYPNPERPQAHEPWLGQLAMSLDADDQQLERFLTLMQAQALPVDAGRLFMDATYAFQRFAWAHSSDNEALRQLALVLFEGYQRLEGRRKDLCRNLALH